MDYASTRSLRSATRSSPTLVNDVDVREDSAMVAIDMMAAFVIAVVVHVVRKRDGKLNRMDGKRVN